VLCPTFWAYEHTGGMNHTSDLSVKTNSELIQTRLLYLSRSAQFSYKVLYNNFMLGVIAVVDFWGEGE